LGCFGRIFGRLFGDPRLRFAASRLGDWDLMLFTRTDPALGLRRQLTTDLGKLTFKCQRTRVVRLVGRAYSRAAETARERKLLLAFTDSQPSTATRQEIFTQTVILYANTYANCAVLPIHFSFSPPGYTAQFQSKSKPSFTFASFARHISDSCPSNFTTTEYQPSFHRQARHASARPQSCRISPAWKFLPASR